MDKKTLYIRVLLIILCFTTGLLCFYQMNQSYDPLARYPYATDENRTIILKYLDSDDIDYLITQQIKPETFLEFIEESGFELHNAYLYSTAKNVQDASNDYIVNFVNKYRQNFSKDILSTLLKHYTYVDLTTYYENEVIFNEDLELVSDPCKPYIILNENTTVYKYVPTDLTTVGSIQVRSEIVSDLEAMKQDFVSVMNGALSLDFTYGYESYEKTLEDYINFSNQYPDSVKYFQMPAGQSEYQLGFTVGLQEANEWLNLCIEYNVFESKDYTQVLENISEENKLKLDWLQENAYRYGFVIRYPEHKETETKQVYQPFVLRYVGKKTAKQMYNQGLVMEEMKFEEELN